MGALAKFERALIVERTKAGLKAAKGRGVHLGRRKSLTAAQVGHARLLLQTGERAGAVAISLKISRSTLYRALAVNK